MTDVPTSNLVSRIRDCLEWRDSPLGPERYVQVIAGRSEEFWEALRLLFVAPAVETQAEPAWTREVGWLIENGESGEKLRYRTVDHGLSTWTADNLKALRFARREDAETFAAEDDAAWRIAEHVWSGPPVQASCKRHPAGGGLNRHSLCTCQPPSPVKTGCSGPDDGAHK